MGFQIKNLVSVIQMNESEDDFFRTELEVLVDSLLELNTCTLRKITNSQYAELYAKHIRQMYDKLLKQFPDNKELVEQIVLRYVSNPIYSSFNFNNKS